MEGLRGCGVGAGGGAAGSVRQAWAGAGHRLERQEKVGWVVVR